MSIPFIQKARRGLSAALCVALTAAVVCMAAAVLVQALAVLVIAVLAASLLLPHPLKWYAQEGADAVKLFIREIFSTQRSEYAQEECREPACKTSGPAVEQEPAPRKNDEN